MEKEEEKRTDKFRDNSTIDLALRLSDYEDEEIEEICLKLNDEKLAVVLEEADEKIQIVIMAALDNKRVLNVFSYMSKDDIADILGIVKVGRAKELINLMKERRSNNNKKIIRL